MEWTIEELEWLCIAVTAHILPEERANFEEFCRGYPDAEPIKIAPGDTGL